MTAKKHLGHEMHEFATQMWPINRSLTGQGFRDSLDMVSKHLPELQVFEVPTGTAAFDWKVPKEWTIRSAFIISPTGKRICDFAENNLHVIHYSTPIDIELDLKELLPHLHSLPEQPSAIPYLTSYYEESWGFCISEDEKQMLEPGKYRVFIDSSLHDGSLTFGEVIFPGKSEKEVFFSTYLCHPSMANNELSGPVVTTYLAKLIKSQTDRRFTYRFVFLPETIGSLTYLSRNLEEMKKNIIAGYTVTCIGDNRSYSFLPSRGGSSLSDNIARRAFQELDIDYINYEWTHRGSDERQYCSPGIDLPVASVMRTKYGEYPEYHTSLDNLSGVVTPDGLLGGYLVLRKCIGLLETQTIPLATQLGEPHLTKHELYPSLSTKNQKNFVRNVIDLLTWSDGSKTLLDIAQEMGVEIEEVETLYSILLAKGLLRAI